MQTIQSVNEMQSHAIGLRSSGRLIGLVPTMGCLHEGHLSLIDIAKEKADKVIVSIFVNPTQFGPNEDYDRYPRMLEEDIEKCRERGADIVFNPSLSEMYPDGYSTYVTEEAISEGLCGISRPHHFRGVTTVCLKLFNITRPDIAVFGQKDAQQCAVIRKVVNDLNIPAEVVIGPTHRDPDGLATSSRNAYLSTLQRSEALSISKALNIAKGMIEEGTRSVDRVVAEITHHLSLSRRVRVIYVQIVDRDTMKPAREILPGKQVITVAVWVDQTRLIDNILI
ncbi:MAG: pantoate--beta-alanine ligase [Opitutales bacterium]|jgi:pantoate--beta-alanine ligase|nr:pantoate--beta-alanine ligase [Opitutales bacterium]MDP4643531.1 pantoate--beta-alanine ligase [Opitutales bacterium]MDP4778387.1 pantoate--beta-alanine ligase [Opitutales bacterium]MDP4879158.1 pantoate--beta-alanine ligase [Opitutales bacterium]MDP4884078.1 pantoate--beta-alanine ligase [Opitutales bacterium]